MASMKEVLQQIVNQLEEDAKQSLSRGAFDCDQEGSGQGAWERVVEWAQSMRKAVKMMNEQMDHRMKDLEIEIQFVTSDKLWEGLCGTKSTESNNNNSN